MKTDFFASRIRLRHIHCFVSVAQERNLGKAADKLRLSQPAISKTLAELESIVGVRLFERGRQGAQLTRDGKTFLTHALSVMQALDAAKNSVGMEQAPKEESVYLGALPTAAPDLLPMALNAFRSANPHARVAIQTATNSVLLEMLKAGEVDFVLGRMAEPQTMLGLSFELLYVEPLILAVRNGHPLCASGTVSLDKAVAFPLVVSTRGTIPRHNIENYLQARGLRLPANAIETISVSLGRLITRQSDCVWFTTTGTIREELESGSLVQLAVLSQGTEEPVGLFHRSEGRLPSAAIQFMKILRESAAARRQG